MTRLASRLRNLEVAADAHYQRMFTKSQQMLGLPLPPESDINDGLRRLQACLERCQDATEAERESIMSEFKQWVDAEHQRFRLNNAQE